MTTVELRKKQILCMLRVKEEDYTPEEIETILSIGQIVYNIREIENAMRKNNA